MKRILWIDNQDTIAGFYIETPHGPACSMSPRDCTTFDNEFGKVMTRARELEKLGYEVTILCLC